MLLVSAPASEWSICTGSRCLFQDGIAIVSRGMRGGEHMQDLAYVPGNVSVQCMDGSLPHGESSMTTDSMATGTAEALAVLR